MDAIVDNNDALQEHWYIYKRFVNVSPRVATQSVACLWVKISPQKVSPFQRNTSPSFGAWCYEQIHYFSTAECFRYSRSVSENALMTTKASWNEAYENEAERIAVRGNSALVEHLRRWIEHETRNLVDGDYPMRNLSFDCVVPVATIEHHVRTLQLVVVIILLKRYFGQDIDRKLLKIVLELRKVIPAIYICGPVLWTPWNFFLQALQVDARSKVPLVDNAQVLQEFLANYDRNLAK